MEENPPNLFTRLCVEIPVNLPVFVLLLITIKLGHQL
jgi:hypothetical protein